MSLLNKLPLAATLENDSAVLRTLDYEPHLVGGVLRVAALGGSTKDVDVAILSHQSNTLHGVLERLGYVQQHSADSKYGLTQGFVADYRKDDINIILYNPDVYSDIEELVSTFDLNINKYYIADGVLCNDHFDGCTVLYTEHSTHQRNIDRVNRFRQEYPNLDWSLVNV